MKMMMKFFLYQKWSDFLLNNYEGESVLICFVYSVFEKKFFEHIICQLESMNKNYWDKGKFKIIKICNSLGKLDIKYEFEKVIQKEKYSIESISVIYIYDKSYSLENKKYIKEQAKAEIEALKEEKKLKKLEFYEIDETIEDLIKIDIKGVCDYLKINFETMDFEPMSGYKTLEKLFEEKNKMYNRNKNTNMLKYINYELILEGCKDKVNRIL